MAHEEWGKVQLNRFDSIEVHTHEGYASVWLTTFDTVTQKVELHELTPEQALSIAKALTNAATKEA